VTARTNPCTLPNVAPTGPLSHPIPGDGPRAGVSKPTQWSASSLATRSGSSLSFALAARCLLAHEPSRYPSSLYALGTRA
jgi:hypothetical protein